MTHHSRALLLAALVVAGGCFWCLKPWQRFPMPRPADHYCFETGVHGWEIFVWDCINGEHVVIGQYTAELMCQNPIKQVAACGAKTPLEVAHAGCAWRPDDRWPR